MVESIPYNVRKELIRLLPSSVVKHVTSFVFYDYHPGEDRRIDITICTDNGMLKEYCQRDLISSIHLGTGSMPTAVRILRNSKAELFYLISTNDELIIISSNEKLEIFERLTNVDHFSVVNCSGHGKCIQVTKKDDAVPLVFDENFKSIGELFCDTPMKDTVPIVTELRRKLIEARYVVKSNEKKYKEHVLLRHLAVIKGQQKLHSNHGDVCFKSDERRIQNLKITTQRPWVKVCNKMLVIVLTIQNENEQSVKDVQILLNAVKIPNLSYTTKIFKQVKINNHTQLQEVQTGTVESKCEALVAAVVDLEEVKVSAVSGIDLKVLVSFKLEISRMSQSPTPTEHVMPVEDIVVSTLDTLGDQFEALSKLDEGTDRNHTMVAILSTTEKTDLRLRRIDDPQNYITDLFTEYLHMERISPVDVVYMKSPYHVLYGAMVSMKSNGTSKVSDVSFHTRSKSQLLALLHSINDAIPERLIMTPLNYTLSAKIPKLNEYTERTPEITETDNTNYASTILNRTKTILEYLDHCMVKMNESKDPLVLNQIGSKIDLNACGKTSFELFRNKLLEEAGNVVGDSQPVDGKHENNFTEDEKMVID